MQIIVLCFLLLLSTLLPVYSQNNDIKQENLAAAEEIIGMSFTWQERSMMQRRLQNNRRNFQNIRNTPLENATPPSLVFDPIPLGAAIDIKDGPFTVRPVKEIKRPGDLDDLAFYSIPQLAQLLRTRQVTSVELTTLCLERLKKYDPKLQCVISYTEELAMQQAKHADEEIATGNYRGLLHGIPYGLKDLFAVKDTKTTWGAMAYKDQVIDENATVYERLEAAGAVLVAKLTLGALAMGDVWYGGTTKNPWNLEQGSSGSSAGSASAVAAGLLPFAIGTETMGSIISPSTRCGVTGLRPTFGRVSRHGGMALTWSMDKIGPICRSAEDCAIVFNAIYGPDGKDASVIDQPFSYQHDLDLKSLRIGYLKNDFEKDYGEKENDQKTLQKLREIGIDLIPIELPDDQFGSLFIILDAEAAAAFDDLTRSNRDDLLVRQTQSSWPNSFRASRFIPAVEYIQANRIRYKLIQQMAEIMKQVDVYVAPTFRGDNLLITNFTGHPSIALPNGFNENGSPMSITMTANLFEEGKLLRVAKAFQDATDFHNRKPNLDGE